MDPPLCGPAFMSHNGLRVAYLLAADNVSRPLPSRLSAKTQPVIRSRSLFSRPDPVRLACLGAYLRHAVLRPSTATHCGTVLASTSNTRAVARMPHPSARQVNTSTLSSTAIRLPYKRVPGVSKKEPWQAVQWNCRQGSPLGWLLARRFPRPNQPR
jgi:hypothetical protein